MTLPWDQFGVLYSSLPGTFACIRPFQSVAVRPLCIFGKDTLLSLTQHDSDGALQICTAGCSRVHGALLRVPSICSPDQQSDKYEFLMAWPSHLQNPDAVSEWCFVYLQN